MNLMREQELKRLKGTTNIGIQKNSYRTENLKFIFEKCVKVTVKKNVIDELMDNSCGNIMSAPGYLLILVISLIIRFI